MSSPLTGPASKKTITVISLILFGLYAYCLYQTAWLADDAFITFRTVRRLLEGDGIGWNPDERVQTFTHPLWMLLLSLAGLITRELLFTSIFLSIGISMASMLVLIFKSDRRSSVLPVGLSLLIFSKAYLDYSTSGLENCLTHVILLFFLLTAFKDENDQYSLFHLAFFAGLGVLNRMDTLLLFLPMLLLKLFEKQRSKRIKARRIVALVLGFMPFILWEFFSLIYYGTPFPNPAYSKLGAGISRFELMEQGTLYLKNSLFVDPITLTTVGLTFFIGLFKKNRLFRAISAAIFLYLLYILWIGGDFMSGRFLTPVLFCAVFMLTRLSWKPRLPLLILILTVIAFTGTSTPYSSILRERDYKGWSIDRNGIADERGVYFRKTGLINRRHQNSILHENPMRKNRRRPSQPEQLLSSQVVNAGKREKKKVILHGNVGIPGFYAHTDTHIVDFVGLTDPLLARLPAIKDPNRRIGHFRRVVPAGYLESIEKDEILLKDRSLGQFYEKLRSITRGPLWNNERLINILKMNMGLFDHLIDHEKYARGEGGRKNQGAFMVFDPN